MSVSLNRVRWRLLPVVGAMVLGLTACGQGSGPSPVAPAGGVAWHGVEPSPVPGRPTFVLRDTTGRRFDFRAETSGLPTLLYFGYTNCPDECPTAMADIAAALRQVGPDLQTKTKVIFVTTDPQRDTPAGLRKWLDGFSSTFTGLLGSKREVDAAQAAVGIPPASRTGPIPTTPGKPNEHPHKPGTAPHSHDGPLGYGVAHANVIFAYSWDDKLPVVYPGGSKPSDIAADLPALAGSG